MENCATNHGLLLVTSTIVSAQGEVKATQTVSKTNADIYVGKDIRQGTIKAIVTNFLKENQIELNDCLVVTFAQHCAKCGHPLSRMPFSSFVLKNPGDWDDLYNETVETRKEWIAYLAEALKREPTEDEQLEYLVEQIPLEEALFVMFAEGPLDLAAIGAEVEFERSVNTQCAAEALRLRMENEFNAAMAKTMPNMKPGNTFIQ